MPAWLDTVIGFGLAIVVVGLVIYPAAAGFTEEHPQRWLMLILTLLLGPIGAGISFAFLLSHRKRVSQLASATGALAECSACGAHYDPADYTPSAPEWLCSRCGHALR